VLELGVGLFAFSEGAVEEVPIDGQQHSKEGCKGAPTLRVGDCDAVEDVVDGHDEDGSGGVQSVHDVYGQIEEGLREDEAVYHQQNVAYGHHSDGLSAKPHFILQHFRQIEEEKHHSPRKIRRVRIDSVLTHIHKAEYPQYARSSPAKISSLIVAKEIDRFAE